MTTGSCLIDVRRSQRRSALKHPFQSREGEDEPLRLLLCKSQLPLARGAKGQQSIGSPPWGRAGAQRLRGGILRISRTSNLLPMFLLKQWPPLRVQPCRFRQKRRISTSSAQCAHWAPSPPGEGLRVRSFSSHYGFLTVSKTPLSESEEFLIGN